MVNPNILVVFIRFCVPFHCLLGSVAVVWLVGPHFLLYYFSSGWCLAMRELEKDIEL